jgi:hypothetical protein
MVLALCFALPLAAVGCDGVVSDPGGTTGPGGPTGPGTDPRDPRLEARVWRLTPGQYNSEVARLLGDGAPVADLPQGAAEFGITNISEGARIDLGNASVFNEAARSVGTWAATQGATVARCDSFGTPACVDQFLGWFPEAAYRRPPTEAEMTALRSVYDDLARDYDANYAFSGLVRTVLLSPQFLYRWEIGEDGAGIVQLTDYEIASLLAFSITDRAPDDMLLADAGAGRLRDPSVRESHARRLMDQSAPVWQRFFWEWLQMSTLYSQGNETGLDAALVQDLEAEYRAYVENIVVQDRGTLRDLLTTSHTWATPAVAEYYGATHPGSGVQQFELDPTQRGGLLTLGAWLVSHGKAGRDNVVRRGMAVFRDAMCNQIRPLDIDLEAALRELVGADASIREIVEARAADSTCGACHRLADPVGLAFETYAGDGSWQTVYASDGRPVEAMVELPGVGAIDNAPQLSAALADDESFQQCLVQRFGHFVMGADVGPPALVRWPQEAHAAFLENEGSFEELLVAIVRDPAFIERRK